MVALVFSVRWRELVICEQTEISLLTDWTGGEGPKS
jgi:hypothetical protein